jgi:cytochrome c biogenesis factor
MSKDGFIVRFSIFYASTIYQIFPDYFMARIGMIIVIGAIVISMGVAMYMYTQYQTNFIIVKAGEPVIIGPVEYTVAFDGVHKGNDKTAPENIFVKIKVNAKNISNEETRISGNQFYLIDEKQQKYQSIHGGFSTDDISDLWLEPNKPVEFTTQFDAPYDEQKQFSIVIRPTKQQSSVDIASICIINC